MHPIRLQCEYAENPLGIDVARPQLRWQLDAGGHDRRQTAYRVTVADTDRAATLVAGSGTVWDSGVVTSSETWVVLPALPLASNRRYHWRVQVWDEASRVSRWSAAAFWETGLLRAEDWQGRWIGAGATREPRPEAGFFKSTNELAQVAEAVHVDSRSALLRKEFHLDRPVRRARAFVTGLGYYEFSCNGRKVGDHVLAPAKTNYRKWVLYDTYDLKPYLQSGANAVGLHLGNGWFNPTPKWWEPYRMQWFGAKRARAQIQIEFEDGSSTWIGTDGTWRTAPGPVLAACVYDGETYDATAALPGWDRAGFDDSTWVFAHVVEAPGGQMVSQPMPPIRVTEHLRPRSMSEPRPGVYVYDLGQNAAGWVRLTVSGPRGSRVQLRYAEDLRPDGMIDPTSNERALATDTYVLSGANRETYEPRFTYHGFRYVEVTGLPGRPSLDSVLGCVVHTACRSTGTFHCANPLINRIHRATVWSQRGCMIGYPLDCPQRDERLGWMGDAMVSAEECWLNFDSTRFYRHWLDGIRFNQNPANGDISIVSPRPYLTDEPDPTWSSAYPVTLWQFYLHHGDRPFLADHFQAMADYVTHLGTQATNHILPRYWIGDWGSIVPGWKEGDPPSVTTAFYYLDAVIVAKAARVLGRTADAERFDKLAQSIRTSFRATYYDARRQQFDQGTQFSNAFPLYLGLADADERDGVLRNILADLDRQGGHFDVGVLGAKYLIDALTVAGRPDVAYGLAIQPGYPGWAHLLDQGQTTLSEFWDLHGSHNHVMLGSIDAWFYRTLAGVQLDEERPGFAHFYVRPFRPASLDAVKATVVSVRGPIGVAWSQGRRDWRLQVAVPANTSATIQVPATESESVQCRPSRTPVRRERDAAVYEVGSGRYEFRVTGGRRQDSDQ